MYKPIFLYHSALLIALLSILHPLRAQSPSEIALREHVRILTADSLAGRSVGSVGEKKAAAYISRYFKAHGLEFIYPGGIQDFWVIGPQGDTLSSQNVVGILPGRDPLLREEYIVVGAHYDHIGFQEINVNGRDSLVFYSGADDNASGIALLLELAGMAAAHPYLYNRSLVFVAFGAEEIGLVGSWYFVNRAFSPISQTVFMINIDMIGRSGPRNTFSAYTVAPHIDLIDMLESVEALLPTLRPKVFDTDYFPSDHKNFFLRNIPSVLFTSGLHSDYHRSGDKYTLLDYVEMERRMAFINAFILLAANIKTLPVLLPASTDQGDRIYTLAELDKRPTFQRGEEEQFLKSWVHKYLRYPQAAITQGIQGRVVVQFVIEANGSVTQVEVIKSVDPLLDHEAVRVISASPKWKPGIRDKKAVRTQYVVPVYFLLKSR